MFWKYVRKKTKTISSINTLEVNGKMATDEIEIAEELNRHFISVFTNESQPVPNPDKTSENIIDDIEINEELVLRAINKINPYKSQGPDEIHPTFIYETRHSIAKPLAKIFEKSLNECVLPKQWKLANVTPIYKSGSKLKAENY